MNTRSFICGFALITVLALAVNYSPAQNLTTAEQNALIDQIAQQISTGTTTGTSSDNTSGGGGLPLGKDAINYVRQFSPGRSVEAARAGDPQFFGEMFEQPVDEPDLWDRVKLIFIEGLYQAITQTFGSYINISNITIPTAGQ